MQDIEKILILKTVSIFSEVPEIYLGEIAGLIEEVELEDGDQIITKGEIGTEMFIIVSGAVIIYDGSTELAVLNERAVFGELAALSPEPRIASARASGDTLLFKICGDDLFELITDNTDMVRGLVKYLINEMRRVYNIINLAAIENK